MASPKSESLLAELAHVRQLAVAQKLVGGLEKLGFKWRAVGDRENNFGHINIGSDPGHALIERVTNAVDAVIEREAARQTGKGKRSSGMPGSPREASDLWLSIPAGRLSNLEEIKRRQELARNVVVSIHEGSGKRKPSIEIRDLGVGITAEIVPKTILSLGESNKIAKPYLAGAYGQGGSTALASSPYGTLFVSRRQPDLLCSGERDEVAVTFARYVELDPTENRNGRYDYLVGPNGQVAAVPAKALPFEPGTSVVHLDMDIHKYAARMTQLTGSLWWLLQNALFDPVLPIWVEERRASELGPGKVADRRTIVGNYTRLMDDKKERVEHSDSVDVWVQHPAGRTCVKVNYWVMRDREGISSTVDSYVDPYRPISYTLFGQLHGTDERREIADRLQLPNLAKSLIVQVELDGLSAAARRDLLSSTRDRMKQSSFFEQMREQIWDALAEDEDLIRLDQERKDRLLAHYSEKDRDKIKERFARLLERFKAGADAVASGKGSKPGGRPPKTSTSREPQSPLPTRKEPTFIKIANVQKPVKIRLDRSALLRLESDAPDGYLTNRPHATLTLASEPDDVIAMESRSDFRGGRARMTVRPTDRARVGDKGKLTVFLLTSSKQSFTARITYVIEEAEDEPSAGTGGKAKVQVPEPIPVYQEGEGGPSWKDLGWDTTNVAEVHADGRDTKIYVNMDGAHIAKLLRGAGYQEVGIKRMKNSYLLYSGFYAYAQHVSLHGKKLGIEGKEFEDYIAGELDRVSQTVVHTIAAAGRLEGDEE